MTIAFWCVLAAIILPYVPLGLASRSLDPKTPRKGIANLEGLPARAYGAHLNAFEAFAPFAAAVIISRQVEGASSTVDVIALIFIVARLAHMGFYLANAQPLRTAAFFVGLVAVIAIFVQTAIHGAG
jgi:uncharacterized MAPEG superfamily protein